MELSKEGKKYLNRCCRIDLLRVVSDFKMKTLREDEHIAYDLADVIAYYIAISSDSKSEAAWQINEFLKHLICEVNRFMDDPSGWIHYVEQRYENR